MVVPTGEVDVMSHPASWSLTAAATSLVVTVAMVIPVEATPTLAVDFPHSAMTVDPAFVEVERLVDSAIYVPVRATLFVIKEKNIVC